MIKKLISCTLLALSIFLTTVGTSIHAEEASSTIDIENYAINIYDSPKPEKSYNAEIHVKNNLNGQNPLQIRLINNPYDTVFRFSNSKRINLKVSGEDFKNGFIENITPLESDATAKDVLKGKSINKIVYFNNGANVFLGNSESANPTIVFVDDNYDSIEHFDFFIECNGKIFDKTSLDENLKANNVKIKTSDGFVTKPYAPDNDPQIRITNVIDSGYMGYFRALKYLPDGSAATYTVTQNKSIEKLVNTYNDKNSVNYTVTYKLSEDGKSPLVVIKEADEKGTTDDQKSQGKKETTDGQTDQGDNTDKKDPTDPDTTPKDPITIPDPNTPLPVNPGTPDPTPVTNVAPSLYRVVLDLNDGSIPTVQYIEFGDCIKEPVTPTREGYVFEGWFIDRKDLEDLHRIYPPRNEDTLVKFDFNTKITKDLTLYARWKKEEKKEVVVEDVQQPQEIKQPVKEESKIVPHTGVAF